MGSIGNRNFTGKLTRDTITISGTNGEFSINYRENSVRTKAFKRFTSQVLAAYGTEGVEEIQYLMDRR